MSTTLLTCGLACVIAAIVGGRLKAWGIEIPALQSLKRQGLLALLGVVLIIGACLIYVHSQPPTSGTSGSTPGNQAQSENSTKARPHPPERRAPIQQSEHIRPAANNKSEAGALQKQGNNASGGAASSLAKGLRVVTQSGNGIAGADILMIASDGRHWEQFSNQDGSASFVNSPHELSGIFCACEGYEGYYQPLFDPTQSLRVILNSTPTGGSKIIAENTEYISGLEGRLDFILDNLNRTYLYAENISIDGGKIQPAAFTVNHSFQVVDNQGKRFELTVVKIIGRSSLINYRSE